MRTWKAVVLGCVLATAMFVMPPAASAWRPNIVVIMADDQPEGEVLKTMQTVRREIAWKGVSFRNSFVNFSLCCPSRSSFLTGLAAHNHNVLNNDAATDGGFFKFFSQGWENHTIAVWLQRAGYSTALIGKYLNQYPKNAGVLPNYMPPGWDEWRVGLHGHPYYNYKLNENGVVRSYGATAGDYSTDVLARKAVRFIRKQAGTERPFFLAVMVRAPHTADSHIDGISAPVPAPRHVDRFATAPLPPWPSFNEVDVSDKPGPVRRVPPMDADAIAATTLKYRRMRESMLAVDDLVRRVLTELTAAGKLDKTILVYTSDNGLLYGQHRLRGKQVPYENSIRVPLYMRGPGIPRGQNRRQLVNNLDLVATIVAKTKATPDHPIDGHDLTPIIKDRWAPWRTAMLVHGSDRDIDSGGSVFTEYFAVRTSRYLYASHQTINWGAEEELYDLAADPDELTNIVGEPRRQRMLNTLRSILATLKTCSGDSCWYDAAIVPTGSSSAPVRRAPASRQLRPDIFTTRQSYELWQDRQDELENGGP